jgi:hypothetical protein
MFSGEEKLSEEELIALFEFRQTRLMQLYAYLAANGQKGNQILGVVLTSIPNFSNVFSSDTDIGINLGWNYLDAFYSVVLGTFQILDEEDYQQTQTKIKGVINLASGIQMFFLSFNPLLNLALGLSSTTISGFSFAFSTLCALITASLDTYNAYVETNFEGWLVERAKEWDFLQKRVQYFEEKKTTTTESEPCELSYLCLKIKQLQARTEEINAQIHARCRVFCSKDSKNLELVTSILKSYSLIYTHSEPQDGDWELDKQIQNDCKTNLKNIAKELSIEAINFIGMMLLSGFMVAHPILVAGTVIVAIVALNYLYEFSSELISIKQCGFFKKPEIACIQDSQEQACSLT